MTYHIFIENIEIFMIYGYKNAEKPWQFCWMSNYNNYQNKFCFNFNVKQYCNMNEYEEYEEFEELEDLENEENSNSSSDRSESDDGNGVMRVRRPYTIAR